MMKYSNGISMLSFGAMRLPRKFEESEKIVLRAIELGINYFDTAYVYPGNEELLGKILQKNNCREKINIATKLPHYLLKDSNAEKYFQTQLERLKTTYIDYYLMHMLPDVATWEKLNVVSWLEEKKASGAIRNLGFSYHGNTENFIKLIDTYDWDFVMVQYNYMDENSQASRKGVEHAAFKGIPVFVMEPLRGGLLTNSLPSSALEIMKEKGDESPAYWGLRWLWNQDTVSSVLSGMNTLEIVEENVKIASEKKEIIDIEFYEKIKKAINEKMRVTCTGCSYCMPCPFGVDIPTSFRCYNSSYVDGYLKGFQEYIMSTTFTKETTNVGRCTGCGKCLPHCPQSINIPVEMKKVKGRFEHIPYKIAKKIIARKLHK